MAIWSGFIGGSGVAQSPILDCEETINFYEERLPSKENDNVSALFPTPGFTTWATVADVGSRAALVANGRLFMVIGSGFYEFDQNGTATKRNAALPLGIDANPAQIIFNGIVGGQLGIASGGNFYFYDLTSNVITQVAALTGKCTQIAYAAGFGLAFDVNTGKVQLSNLNDLSVFNAGIFFQRSLFSDPYQAMFVDANNLVWLLGTDTFEVRYNSGVGTQPFIPLSGLVGAYGIVAPFAFSQTGLGNFWLARNPQGVGQFVMSRGNSPQVVSSYAFNTAVAGYLRAGRITDAEVLSYQQEGHTFLVPSFPSSQAAMPTTPTTWAYDAEGQGWAKRGRWTGSHWDIWAPRVHVFAFNKHLVGDRATGLVSVMDTSTPTEIDGSGIVRERTTPAINSEHRRVPIDNLELLMDVGLGTPSGQGADPTATLRVSVDGGRTFGNERRAGFGRMGEYGRRVYWSRLGAPASLVARVRITDPVPTRVVGAYLNNFEGKAA